MKDYAMETTEPVNGLIICAHYPFQLEIEKYSNEYEYRVLKGFVRVKKRTYKTLYEAQVAMYNDYAMICEVMGWTTQNMDALDVKDDKKMVLLSDRQIVAICGALAHCYAILVCDIADKKMASEPIDKQSVEILRLFEYLLDVFRAL